MFRFCVVSTQGNSVQKTNVWAIGRFLSSREGISTFPPKLPHTPPPFTNTLFHYVITTHINLLLNNTQIQTIRGTQVYQKFQRKYNLLQASHMRTSIPHYTRFPPL